MSSSQNANVTRIVSKPAEGEAQEAVTAEAPRTPQTVAAPVETAPEQKKKKRSPVLPILGIALLAGAAYFGYQWFTVGRFMISTDDAYIEGDIATISPKVTGYVAKVNVVANQQVKVGDTLATLDDGDYKLALEQAQASLDTEKLSLQRIDAQIAGGEASLDQAKAQKVALDATVRGAQITQTRASELQAKSVGTTASLDTANIALDQAKANLVGGDAAIASAEANVTLLHAQRREAEGTIRQLELARDKAARDLSFTVLKAPYDGVVGNRSVQEGDLVSPGQRLMALVPVRQLYIDANFKETRSSIWFRAPRSMSMSTPMTIMRSSARWNRFRQHRVRCSRCCRLKTRRATSPRSSSAYRFASPCRRTRSIRVACAPASASLSTSTRARRRMPPSKTPRA